MTIPASDFVQINPGVIGAGGAGLDLNGLLITANAQIPIGAVPSFPNALAVEAFFGPSANETLMAQIYFAGRNNATLMPGALLMAQFNAAAVGAYLRGASMQGVTLTQLKAYTGTLTITVDGTALTSASISLSAATSFTDAATIILAAFTSPTFGVTYNNQLNAFEFASTATTGAETITYASGTLAPDLLLEQSNGAVLSQGAVAQTPAGLMATVISKTLNWAAFTTAYDDTEANKVAYAQWNNAQNNRFAWVNWTTNAAAKITPDTTTAMATINTDGYSGVVGVFCVPVLDPGGLAAAGVMGFLASLDFSRTNGRSTLAFKYTGGIPVSVSDATDLANLTANGYNAICAVATANQGFTFWSPGQVSGIFKWLDTYADQIYLNSQLQLAMMILLTNVNAIPYNPAGNALIHAAAKDPILQMLNFGGIVPGVVLSSLQIAEVNNAAGTKIDTVLSARGWFLQIGVATAQVRRLRGSPPITLWYMDGGSVQSIVLASIVVM
jgi:hypothetical protein